jgi:microcompartment protein CcmL/EutN
MDRITPHNPPPSLQRPALASVELTSIARGIRMTDEMAKKAPVRVPESATICPGKYLVVIGGEVEMVEQSYNQGLEVAGPAAVDELFLPNAHQQLIPAIGAVSDVGQVDSVGVVETFAAAEEVLGQRSGMLLRTEVIARPNPQMVRWLF